LCVNAADVFWTIELQRVQDELTNGNFTKARELAEGFQAEFRDSWAERPIRERQVRKLEYKARMMNVRFALASAQKQCGLYREAKTGLESALNDFEEVRDKLWQQVRISGAYRGAYEQMFLLMWDKGAVRGMANAAQAANAAGETQASLQSELFDLECTHALLLDTLGAMELDCGNLTSAEKRFRDGLKVREFLGGPKLQTLGGPHLSHYATVCRNFGRLFLKQGDERYRNGDVESARKLYDRADAYFSEANGIFEDCEKADLSSLLKAAELGMADLLFNKAELAMARAVYMSEQEKGKNVEDLLDQAEQWLLEAADIIEKQLETRDHPYLIFCWANLAGVSARRVILLDKELEDAAADYVRQSEELIAKRDLAPTCHQATVLQAEKAWVARAGEKVRELTRY